MNLEPLNLGSEELFWKRTTVLCVSLGGPKEQTRQMLDAMRGLGADVMLPPGIAEVALARSIGISRMLLRVEQGRDLVLMVDDDIVMTLGDACALVELAAVADRPVSAVYATAARKVAASPYGKLWLAGLGALAMKLSLLLDLKPLLPSLTLQGSEEFSAWCCAGLHPLRPRAWTSEDFWFCLNFGGVHLAPVAAGHLKPQLLLADQTTLDRVAEEFAKVRYL